MQDLFCTCGIKLGTKNLITDEVSIDKGVEYSISLGYPTILYCYYCDTELITDGIIVDIR